MNAVSGAESASRLRYTIVRGIDLTLWAVQVLTGLLFVVFGANKFNPRSELWTSIFGKAGANFWYSQGSESVSGSDTLTGTLEMACGILLFTRKPQDWLLHCWRAPW
jgi:uncharacterized membrane protein YphA (DoxX/SURF4 family)